MSGSMRRPPGGNEPGIVPEPVRQLYRFDSFAFSTSPLRLDRDGVRLDLRPQALRVLQKLIENVGSVVPFDRLLTGESNSRVRTAVAQLRRALEDPIDSPRYVETVRAHGYRFVHRVELVEEPLLLRHRRSQDPTRDGE